MPLRHALLAAPLVLLAACSSSSASSFKQPAASSFHAGGCASAAKAVLALGKDANTLQNGKPPSTAMASRLNTNQDTVYNVVNGGVDAAVKPSLNALVVSVGVVRIRNDSTTYAPSLGKDMLTAYQAVITACTT